MDFNKINNICRLCLSNDDDIILIRISDEQKERFEELTGIELNLDPSLPAQVCSTCADDLDNFYIYRQKIINKQNELKELIQTKEIYEDIEILDEDLCDDLSLSKIIKCPLCAKEVNTRKALRSHQRSHNTDKKYKCPFDECDKAFRYQHHLVNHERIHNQSSPFECDLCHISFRQKYSLTLHKRKHTKNFLECEDCKSQFIMKSQMKKHICDGIFRPYIIKPRLNIKK